METETEIEFLETLEEPGGRDKAMIYLLKELGTTLKEIKQYLVQQSLSSSSSRSCLFPNAYQIESIFWNVSKMM
jgi:hypothetical protein